MFTVHLHSRLAKNGAWIATLHTKQDRTHFTFMWPCIVTNFFLIKPTDTLISQLFFVKKLYVFRAFLCPSSGVFHCTFSTGICHGGLMTSFKYDQVVLESCHQTCMTYTSAEYTVENSWWWAEEMPETRRVSWQNKFGKLVRLFVLLKRRQHVVSARDIRTRVAGIYVCY